MITDPKFWGRVLGKWTFLILDKIADGFLLGVGIWGAFTLLELL